MVTEVVVGVGASVRVAKSFCPGWFCFPLDEVAFVKKRDLNFVSTCIYIVAYIFVAVFLCFRFFWEKGLVVMLAWYIIGFPIFLLVVQPVGHFAPMTLGV